VFGVAGVGKERRMVYLVGGLTGRALFGERAIKHEGSF
jgi:hypothetical protein